MATDVLFYSKIFKLSTADIVLASSFECLLYFNEGTWRQGKQADAEVEQTGRLNQPTEEQEDNSEATKYAITQERTGTQ